MPEDNHRDEPSNDRTDETNDNTEEFPANMNSSDDDPKYTTPPHEVQTDENGDPDYEATIEAMGLEYDAIYRIGNDRYRYRGHRTGSIVVEPLSEYCDLTDDCLRVEYMWAVYQEGNVEAITSENDRGMVAEVETDPGTTTVRIEPDSARDSHVYFNVEGVPELAGFYLDYHHGEERPMVYFHDADCERVAFEILLPNEDNPKAQLVCDRTQYYRGNIPDEIEDRILDDNDPSDVYR